MGTFSQDEVARLARLAQIHLGADDAERLAAQLDAIAREFSTLQQQAATLPEPADPPAGALREDVAAPAPAEEVEAILRAAPRVDPGTRAVVAPRSDAP